MFGRTGVLTHLRCVGMCPSNPRVGVPNVSPSRPPKRSTNSPRQLLPILIPVPILLPPTPSSSLGRALVRKGEWGQIARGLQHIEGGGRTADRSGGHLRLKLRVGRTRTSIPPHPLLPPPSSRISFRFGALSSSYTRDAGAGM